MLTELTHNKTISPFKKGLLPYDSSVYIYLTRDLTNLSYIDSFAPRRISTIIAASIVHHSSRIEQDFNSFSERETPSGFPFEKNGQPFDYIFNPSILKWLCNQTCPEPAGNSITLRIDILSGKTGNLLDSIQISRETSFTTEFCSSTCELLIDPLDKIVPALFQSPGQQ